MACREFEPLIALHVEDDLPAADRARVELHIRVCAHCMALADDLKESQTIFKSIRQNVPDQSMLQAVRARVLAEAGAARMSSLERIWFGVFRQWATLAGIAVFLLGAGALWLMHESEETSRPVAVVPTPAPLPATRVEPAVPKPVPVVSVPKAPERRRKPAPESTAPPVKQVAIKLLTDDPNVIIYWLVDEKGD